MEKIYYTITEVCGILELKPHIIRYWETEFSQLKTKVKKGNYRRFTTKEIDLMRLIKELIYERKFTLEGAVAEVKRLKSNETETTENEPKAEKTPKVTATQIMIPQSEGLPACVVKELMEVKAILMKRTVNSEQ